MNKISIMEKDSLPSVEANSVHKHLTIKRHHDKWIEQNHISLSRFVQWAIDEEIKRGLRNNEGVKDA